MYYTIAAAALIPFFQFSRATPLSTVTTMVKPVGEALTIAAKFAVYELSNASVAVQPGTTLASASGAHSDATDDIFPATLLLCPSFDCASCYAFDLSEIPVNQCLQDLSSSFSSVAISQPSNEGLPFAVGVGPEDCPSLLAIPAVNECFNIKGGPFYDFAILE